MANVNETTIINILRQSGYYKTTLNQASNLMAWCNRGLLTLEQVEMLAPLFADIYEDGHDDGYDEGHDDGYYEGEEEASYALDC